MVKASLAESQSLEFRGGYAHSRSPLPEGLSTSGRSTTMDQPYYYLGVAFLAPSSDQLFFVRSVWVEKTA